MRGAALFTSIATSVLPGTLSAQEAGDADVAATPTQDAQAPTLSAGRRVFEPAYFAQFAPRNALDMVDQVPGFTIDEGNQEQRGLGQANQNVIVNGERFSSKSDGIRDQLRRIPAGDVVRIEILDGTSLDLPGLTGQVANVVHSSTGTSGQFRWRTGFRPHNTEAQLYGGELSLTGSEGDLDYTISLTNRNNRFGADGPTLITDGNGDVIEQQFSRQSGEFDNPSLSSNFSYDFASDVKANLNLSYGEDFFETVEPETGITPDGVVRERDVSFNENGPEYEIGADIEFPLAGGTLKLIGLERFERDNAVSVVIDRFNDGTQSTGSRFERVNETGERIGRFEYGWKMWGADLQLSGEAAFNRLDRSSRLFELSPDEQFVEVAFPAGTGGVTEDRYEAILSFSRALTKKLSLQITGGGEYSRIEQTGFAANTRTFQRPKGSLSLAWKPQSDLDVTFEARRSVGQLSFGDFLASLALNDDNQNGGNNELQPFQLWDFELEFSKNLAEWGSVELTLQHGLFEDFVDFFPLDSGGEARGNIGSAERTQVELNTTIKGEPVGLHGMQIDVRAIQRWMSVTDPFTGETRGFSGDVNSLIDINFRHDIPRSDWAWGSGVFSDNRVSSFRRTEVGREFEGPTFMNLFIEHKDVFGLTVNAQIGNVLGARSNFIRTVFDGDRPDADIAFNEVRDRRIGPIFRFSVSGNF